MVYSEVRSVVVHVSVHCLVRDARKQPVFSFFYLVYNFSITGNQTGFASSLRLRAIPIRSRYRVSLPVVTYNTFGILWQYESNKYSFFYTCNKLTMHNDKMPSCVLRICDTRAISLITLLPIGKMIAATASLYLKLLTKGICTSPTVGVQLYPISSLVLCFFF